MPDTFGIIIIVEQGFLINIVVATKAGQIKVGSKSRTDKYNQLLRIDGDLAVYAGMKSFYNIKKKFLKYVT